MATGLNRNAGREQGVDAMRLIAVAAVILLHSRPPAPSAMSTAATLVAMACRFAVPFFFLVSGLYLRVEGRSVFDLALRPLIRLAPVYLGALFIYYVAWHALGIEPWQFSWKDLRNGGPIFHLWFLPALGVGLLFVGLGVRLLGLRQTLAAAVLLAMIGLGLTSYRAFYAAPLPGNRSGWLFAPLFVATGYAIGFRPPQRRLLPAVALAAISYALLVVEETVLARLTGRARIESHDFVLATFPFGVAALLIARGLEQDAVPRWLPKIGRVALGIYIFHLLFLRLCRPSIATGGIIGAAVLAFATLISTGAVAMLLSRIRVARRMVM
jgi:surface polysaccharide O-acyltransferase-like enzyme